MRDKPITCPICGCTFDESHWVCQGCGYAKQTAEVFQNDDDEPITEEWFRDTFLGANALVMHGIEVSCCDDTIPVWLGTGVVGHPLPAVRTRGDVRTLVRLLGRE